MAVATASAMEQGWKMAPAGGASQDIPGARCHLQHVGRKSATSPWIAWIVDDLLILSHIDVV